MTRRAPRYILMLHGLEREQGSKSRTVHESDDLAATIHARTWLRMVREVELDGSEWVRWSVAKLGGVHQLPKIIANGGIGVGE